MQTQDRNKDVVITNFSICGVEGFKTVYASGGKVDKRILSALNYMDRVLKEREKEISSAYDEAEQLKDSFALGKKGEELSLVKRALMFIKTIKDRVVFKNDMRQFAVAGEPQRISTEQFLTESASVYEQNLRMFLAKLDDIDTGIDKHLSNVKQFESAQKPSIYDLEPSLYILSGGIFGDENFHIYLTPLDIEQMGQGDLQKAVQYFVSGAMITVKNFKLTDYLRMTGEAQKKVRADLLFIDAQLDHLHEIVVKTVGSVISPMGMGTGKSKAAYDRVKETSDTLMLESDYRLVDFVTTACNKAQ
jgi:hypothetical protein